MQAILAEAKTGSEAVALARQFEPDVVVTDIPMPDFATFRKRLTAREHEVVQLLTDGKSNKEIAVSLEISTKTVETHRANAMRKLQLHSLTELVRYAIENKIREA